MIATCVSFPCARDSYREISVVEAYAIITFQTNRNVVVLGVRSEGEFNGTESHGHVARP